jgi:hypothetical protein
MCFRGRIQVKSELKHKGWPGEPGCKLCGELETAEHLIFHCPLSNFTWRCLKEAMGWSQTPISFEDFVFLALSRGGVKEKCVMWAIFGAVAWAIWTIRNDHVFNNKICGSPLAHLFKMSSLMSQWTCLLGSKEEPRWKSVLEKIKRVIQNMQLVVRPRVGVG